MLQLRGLDMSSSSTTSMVKTLDKIIKTVVKTELPTTINNKLLFKTGSDLSPIVISQISY